MFGKCISIPKFADPSVLEGISILGGDVPMIVNSFSDLSCGLGGISISAAARAKSENGADRLVDGCRM